ncbi:hypothetical protein Tco_0618166 [Tanacetum coccineum]
MENLSSCDSDVLSEVPYTDSCPNDMLNQDVQEMTYTEQTHCVDYLDDTNSSAPNDLLVLSLVEQMTDQVAILDKENQTNKMVTESLTIELERYKECVAIFKQRLNADSNNHEKLINSQIDDLILNRNAKFAAFQQEIDTLKETLSKNVKEKESLSKTLTVFRTESKEKESKYIDKEIFLEKQNKELENIICKMYRSAQAMHMLTKPQVFYDDTHKQALGYQNPFYLKKAQQIKPTLYDGSFISKEHAVISVIDDDETLILEEESRSKMLDKQNDPISIKRKIKISPIDYSKLNNIKEDFAPLELPKVSLVNESLIKLRYQLASFDKVVKKRTTSDAIIVDEIIMKFKVFLTKWKLLLCSVDKNNFEIQIKQLRIDNYLLLNQIMSQDIMHIAINSVDTLDVNMSCMNDCCKCLELETGLLKKKDFIEKEENSGVNQNAPTFNQLFEINELKAQSQENDTFIRKLKEKIKSLSGKEIVENVKKDIDELETINIELEHSVAKLLSENENLRKEREHLKSIYKDQFDSIKKMLSIKESLIWWSW